MTTSEKKRMGDGAEEEGGEQHPTLEVESIEIPFDGSDRRAWEKNRRQLSTTIEVLVEKGGTRLE